ncbi:hypothetical protein QFZ96_000977 [Paraburkholderia youngii]
MPMPHAMLTPMFRRHAKCAAHSLSSGQHWAARQREQLSCNQRQQQSVEHLGGDVERQRVRNARDEHRTATTVDPVEPSGLERMQGQ